MKRFLRCALLALMLPMLLCGCTDDTVPEPIEEDGGEKAFTNPDAPKVIESEEIISFSCVFSTIALIEEDPSFPNGVYHTEAKLEDGVVTCRYKFHSRDGDSADHTFETDPAFLQKLQQIVKEYDFAAYNGEYHSVSGLPDMYGFSLDILYASGECISAYDNQDNYLSMSAMNALYSLFHDKIS